MHRLDEVTFEGHPVRFAEEWEIAWNVEIKQETNLYVYRMTLAGLKLSIDGAARLQGTEVAGAKAYFDLVLDGEGNVVDIRNTQSLTDALVAVVSEENKKPVSEMFSANNLNLLFFVRTEERGREILGQNAKVGSTWSYQFKTEDGTPAAERTLSVKEEVPCGKSTCVKVARQTQLNQQMVWQGAAASVARFVTDRGGKPEEIALKDADVRLADELLVVPERMEFHATSFDQSAKLSVSNGPEELTVHFHTLRTSEYEY